MASMTNYYTLYDANNSGIFHIYEIVEFKFDDYGNKNGYKFNPDTICHHDDSHIEKDNIKSKSISEKDIIQKIKNILDGKKNSEKLCENCMRQIIAEKQDNLYKKS